MDVGTNGMCVGGKEGKEELMVEDCGGAGTGSDD